MTVPRASFIRYTPGLSGSRLRVAPSSGITDRLYVSIQPGRTEPPLPSGKEVSNGRTDRESSRGSFDDTRPLADAGRFGRAWTPGAAPSAGRVVGHRMPPAPPRHGGGRLLRAPAGVPRRTRPDRLRSRHGWLAPRVGRRPECPCLLYTSP